MQSFLSDIQSQASASVQSMVQAQMTVLKYVQSPTLVDSSLDTLVYSLKESLQESESEKESVELRKLFHRMLANYIFFMDARFKVEVEGNNQAGKELLNEAGATLSKSMVGLASMAVAGPLGAAAVSKMVVDNVFALGGDGGMVAKLIKWFNAKSENARKTKEFYESIMQIIKKLDKYNSLIGRSMLLSGAIERYANGLTGFIYDKPLKDAKKQYEVYEDFLTGQAGKFSINSLDDVISSLKLASGPNVFERYKSLLNELERAKRTASEHSRKIINIHKWFDNIKIRRIESDIAQEEPKIRELRDSAKEKMDKLQKQKADFKNYVRTVAKKYEEI